MPSTSLWTRFWSAAIRCKRRLRIERRQELLRERVPSSFRPYFAACQFKDVFGMLALTKPVFGARPARFGSGRPEDLIQTAHG
jgi:hypothetical protein